MEHWRGGGDAGGVLCCAKNIAPRRPQSPGIACRFSKAVAARRRSPQLAAGSRGNLTSFLTMKPPRSILLIVGWLLLVFAGRLGAANIYTSDVCVYGGTSGG